MEKQPDGLSYLVDIAGRVVIRSRAFLKPVFEEEGQGGAQDHVSQDQGEFHSLSAPPLRRSSRLQEKKEEEEKCFSSSCALVPTTLTLISSGNSSECNRCTDSRQMGPRTSITSRRGDFPSSIFNGPPLPLGQGQSFFVQCSSLPSYSAAGSAPKTSARAGPVPANCLTSFVPRLVDRRPPARDQGRLWQGRASKENSAFQATLSPLSGCNQVDSDPLQLDFRPRGLCPR